MPFSFKSALTYTGDERAIRANPQQGMDCSHAGSQHQSPLRAAIWRTGDCTASHSVWCSRAVCPCCGDVSRRGFKRKERRACLLSQAARRESKRKIERTHNSLANFKHYLPVTGAKNWPLEREECGVYMSMCARRENARGLKILLRWRIFSKAVAKCCWPHNWNAFRGRRGFLSFCAHGFDFALPPTKKKTRQQALRAQNWTFLPQAPPQPFFLSPRRAANGPLLQCVIISSARESALRHYANMLGISPRAHTMQHFVNGEHWLRKYI